ncbi:MAG: FkbM family methyltransferase [Spirosomataceae bacterium]
MNLSSFIRRSVFYPLGIDIRKYPDWVLKSRINLLNANKITTVIDVGANIGQYASQIRRLGFDGRIISIEPQKKEFNKLSTLTKKYKNWEAINIALGDYDGISLINIASNSHSSSLLET